MFPDVHSLNTATFGPYAQISDEELGYFSCCLQFGKNALTSDQKHCDLSELPDIHSLDIVIFRGAASQYLALPACLPVCLSVCPPVSL